jgi:hypothetical protein
MASIFARVGVSNNLLRTLIPGKCLTIIKDLWGVYGGGILPMYQPPILSENNEKKRATVGAFDDSMNIEEPEIKRT